MRDYTEEELKILSDMLPNIALQLRTSLATVYTAVDRLVPADMQGKRREDRPHRCGVLSELLPALPRDQQPD